MGNGIEGQVDERGRFYGIRFFFPVNEAEELPDGTIGSVTYEVVHGTYCARTNKKRIKIYLADIGIKAKYHKQVMKAMGFWGEALGI